MDIQRIEPGKRMSQAVTFGDMVYLAGQVASDTVGTGVTIQTQQILSEIDRLLAASGSDKERILSTNGFLGQLGALCFNAITCAIVAGDALFPPQRSAFARHFPLLLCSRTRTLCPSHPDCTNAPLRLHFAATEHPIVLSA